MRIKERIVHSLVILLTMFMVSCEYEDVPAEAATATPRPEFTAELELRAQLTQIGSNGALNHELKAYIPLKIKWSDEYGNWIVSGEDPNATGVITMAGGGTVSCQGGNTGRVRITGSVSGRKLQPCTFNLAIFQDWSGATLYCTATVPYTYNYEIPGAIAPFSLTDDFQFLATSGNHSKPVTYTNENLSGHLLLKIKYFSGSLIDGCGVTY